VRLDRISSVSGGSITAALLGLRWAELDFADGVAQALEARLVAPIRAFARETVDVGSVLKGVFLPGSINDKLADAYRRHLFADATLQDLPDDPPRVVINATNVQTGALWRFSRPAMRDDLVGEVCRPTVPLAVAVAASSAFPPLLSPARLALDPTAFSPPAGEPLHRPPFTDEVYLTDGVCMTTWGWKPPGGATRPSSSATPAPRSAPSPTRASTGPATPGGCST